MSSQPLFACDICGKPAVCFGAYEGDEAGYACGDCCAHGNESGWCEPIGKHEDMVDSIVMANPIINAPELVLEPATPTAYAVFTETLKFCDQHITRALLGTCYEQNGVLYRSDRRIGTTIPHAPDNRLRRFVQHGRMLVEVRARGRSGSRAIPA